MSLELHQVTKNVRDGAVRITYEDLNIRVEDGAHMAFLGHPEAGVPGLIELICGADAPDKGRVVRSHSISWMIPATTFMYPHLSLAASARFLARLYEVDEKSYLAKIGDTGLADYLDQRADKLSGDVKSAFAFAAGVSLPFDCYILSKTVAGKKTFPDLVPRLMEDLRQRAGLLLVTSSVKVASEYCDQAYVFDQGRATYYDNMEAAAEHFGSITPKRGREEEEVEDDSDLEDIVATDF
jgi:capsular polysaccharide transport system ATP-binding protein